MIHKDKEERRDKQRLASRKYRAENPEKARNSVRKWAKANRELKRESDHRHYKANRSKRIENTLKWRSENPEKQRVLIRTRRARVAKAEGEFTKEQWEDLKNLYGRICLCCGRKESDLLAIGLQLVPDHVVPLSRGGSNDISNIQPLCHGRKRGSRGGCNQSKNACTVDYRPQTKICKTQKNYQT